MKFAFIRAEKAHFPLTVLCDVLDVSRSGFYAFCARGPSARAERDAVLSEDIRRIHLESESRYGSPRVHAELAVQGEQVSRKRVTRLMREQGLAGKRRRRFKCTTDSKHTLPIAPNLLNRDFTAEQPNTAWVGDTTFVWTHEGWLYLAVILDLFSRRVVGWAMSEHNDSDLVIRAFQMAYAQRRPSPGLIYHSDRGSTYASHAYRRCLDEVGCVPSMSRKGDCWDNAVAESFFATLRKELTNDLSYLSRGSARSSIFEFIEAFYNRKRRHSTIKYQTPQEFELAHIQVHAA